MSYNDGYENVPGVAAADFTEEIDLLWWRPEFSRMDGGLIVSTAEDAGNTPTTMLRAGLLLGQVTATKKYVEWTPAAVDGSERIMGILARSKSTLEAGVAADHFAGSILTDGYVKAARLIVPGAASAGISGDDLEFIIRDQLASRFILDDIRNPWVPRIASLAVNKTIDGTWHGAVLNNIGATGTVTVTLPAPRQGFRLTLHQSVDQDFDVATPSAGQLTLFDGSTAQTLSLDAGDNKTMLIYGLEDTYQAIIIPTTDTT